MKTVSLKLSDSLEKEVRRLARRRRASRSEVIRQALEQLVARDAGSDRWSALARAGDLVGCAEGPSDLARDKKHLRGFGR